MARRKRAWGPSNPLWRWQHHKRLTRATYGGSTKGLRASRKIRSGGYSMARRRYGRRYRRRSGGFGMKRLLSTKNIAYTVGAILLLPRFVSVDSKTAGAVGGFMGAGPVGAIVGYVAAPTISNATGAGTGTSGVVLG